MQYIYITSYDSSNISMTDTLSDLPDEDIERWLDYPSNPQSCSLSTPHLPPSMSYSYMHLQPEPWNLRHDINP